MWTTKLFKFASDDRIFVVGRLVILKYCIVFTYLINEFSKSLHNQYNNSIIIIIHFNKKF
jgi:hypothetical protein